MKRLLLLLMLCLPLQAQPMNPEQEQRYRVLIQELRCLVCQNQNIADSNAPLASDLREQVRDQILAGRSDAEIKTYVTARYGDFVLYRPPFNKATLLLWLGPVLLVLLALGVALRHLRRARRGSEAVTVAVDEAALKRLLEEQK